MVHLLCTDYYTVPHYGCAQVCLLESNASARLAMGTQMDGFAPGSYLDTAYVLRRQRSQTTCGIDRSILTDAGNAPRQGFDKPAFKVCQKSDDVL